MLTLFEMPTKAATVIPHPPPDGVILKEIPEWTGYYASPDGSIWSRKDFHGGLREEYRIRRPSFDKDGYPMMTLRRGARSKTLRLSHLILVVFHGRRPDGTEACHFPDSDISNNRAENLRWGTHRSNIEDKITHGTVARGERHGMVKVSDADVLVMRRMRAEGRTFAHIGRTFHISLAHARLICIGRYRNVSC